MTDEQQPNEVEPELLDLTGSTIFKVGRDYAALYDEQKAAQEKSDTYKRRLRIMADFLTEQMAIEGVDSFNIAGGRNIHRKKKFIASRGKGVQTEDINEVLRQIGWGDLVRESYSAQSLQAAVKERYNAAMEEGREGDHVYCPKCCRFADLDTVHDNPFMNKTCTECGISGQHIIDGIPAELHPLLYVDESETIGSRKSS